MSRVIPRANYIRVEVSPMAKVKQLTVALENQPGRLAAVAKVLADAKVNIVAILGSTAGAQGSAQFVVDNIIKAKKALSAAQFACAEGTLEQVELPNKPGALAAPYREAGQKGREHRCGIRYGAQRREEIRSVFRHLKTG